MKGGSGNSKPKSVKSQPEWRQKSPNSSPNPQTTVQAVVSYGGSVSSISDEKSHISEKGARPNSGGTSSQNITPTDRQKQGWSTFGSGSNSRGGNTRQSTISSKSSNASDFGHDNKYGLKSGQLCSDQKNANKLLSESVKAVDESLRVNLDCAFMESPVSGPDGAQLSWESSPQKTCSEAKFSDSEGIRENEKSESPILKYDLCPPKKTSGVVLKPSLMSKNKAIRKENERSMGGPKGEVLREGMVLLKSYLSISEQVSILKVCQQHGLELGFYQPSFGESGKMHLKLMCFGDFWDPETNQYEKVRPVDGAKLPPVPQKFLELVERAMKDCRSLISENRKVKNVESILPSVKPDICLVNHYSKTGRLGLHQDKDESQASLNKGIPIVSFSIGDSAEFLYSDQRNVEEANKIILESGDVLIFGGKARHIFHGVPRIKPDTAPKVLVEEANFRSGRLNLTFRQRL